jgi:putative flippase GtrA
VTVARRLYERFQQLIHEAAKFGMVGVVGLLITNVGYGLLHNSLGWGPVTSTTVATIVAMVVTYIGNRYWSFRHRERTNVAREGTIFFVLNGIGLLIQDAVVAFNYYVLGFGHNKVAEFIALNAGIAIATLFRFWSYRKWVWAAPGDDAEAGAGRGQPQPADSPMAVQPPVPQEAQGRNGDGRAPHVPDLLHANGHGGSDQGASSGRRSAMNGWDG